MRKLRKVSPFLQECLKSISPEIKEMTDRHLNMCELFYSAKQGDVFIRRDGVEMVFDGKQEKDDETWLVLTDPQNNQVLYHRTGLPYLTLDDKDTMTLISKKR